MIKGPERHLVVCRNASNGISQGKEPKETRNRADWAQKKVSRSFSSSLVGRCPAVTNTEEAQTSKNIRRMKRQLWNEDQALVFQQHASLVRQSDTRELGSVKARHGKGCWEAARHAVGRRNSTRSKPKLGLCTALRRPELAGVRTGTDSPEGCTPSSQRQARARYGVLAHASEAVPSASMDLSLGGAGSRKTAISKPIVSQPVDNSRRPARTDRQAGPSVGE